MERAEDWERIGECNSCGDCCRHATNCIDVVLPFDDEAFGRVRFGEPVTRIGIEGPYVFKIRGPVYAPCPQLIELMPMTQCQVYDTRPQTCRDFPTSPSDIEGTRCSYTFLHRTTNELRTAESHG